ncbi:MAG: protein-export chaperone SecB [Pirellulales bacterium]
MPEGENSSAPSNQPKVGFQVLRHYLKDLSFESPRGPLEIDAGRSDRLQLDTDCSVRTRALEKAELPDSPEDIVELLLTVTGRSEQKVVFLGELTYVAEVRLENVPDLVRPQILNVNVPEFLEPIVNDVIGRVAALAGYPGLRVTGLGFLSDFNRVKGDEWKAQRAAQGKNSP